VLEIKFQRDRRGFDQVGSEEKKQCHSQGRVLATPTPCRDDRGSAGDDSYQGPPRIE
jgi:hypothetical protein